MGVLGGVFVLKSGLRILIRAPEVPFSVPPKTPKMGVFGYFGVTENGTSSARIKILWPLFNINSFLKNLIRTIFGPRKVIFSHIHFLVNIDIFHGLGDIFWKVYIWFSIAIQKVSTIQKNHGRKTTANFISNISAFSNLPISVGRVVVR